MGELKFTPLYKGKAGYTPAMYEREQRATEYSRKAKRETKREIQIDVSGLSGYLAASALLLMVLTVII